MTEKAKKNLNKASIIGLITLLMPLIFGVIAGKINLGFTLDAARWNKMEAQTNQNTTDIQVLKAQMLTEDKVEKLLDANNNKVINELWKAGYIRANIGKTESK